MDIQSLLSSNSNESASSPSTPNPQTSSSPRRPPRPRAPTSNPNVHNSKVTGDRPQQRANSSSGPASGSLKRSRSPQTAAESVPTTRSLSGPTTLDSLADAAIQQQQPPPPPPRSSNANATVLRTTESYEQQGTPTPFAANQHRLGSVSRATPSSPRRPFGVAMGDPPREAIRTDYSNSCLSAEAQETATRLAAEIQRNSHAYEARVQFIRLLHQGFVDHIYPPSAPDSRGDPHRYDVWKDLRAAREELDSLFAIGEDLWVEWIQDESLLATTIEERVGVIELCQRSVEEEFGSTKLWIIYGDWMLHLYNAANSPSQSADGETPAQGQWSDEDKLVARETFKWESVMEVWKNGAEAVRWHINDSHLVWNRYLELVLREVGNSPSAENVSQLRALFDNRLRTPHISWDQTFQLFSTFVSTYFNTNYEDIMVEMTSKAADAKAVCSDRETRELALQRAADAGDTTAEWSAFAEYLDWEVNRKGRSFSYDLSTGLYQRAVLRFPTDANLWEDYMMLVIDQSLHHGVPAPVLPRIERATRHCPWSGALWSHHLLTAEREDRQFSEISNIKHKATRTGLLDAAGIDEVLKVHTTWCSYLRRQAFRADSTDEHLDIAEVGIRSAIESVQEVEKEDKTAPNDPMFRLERIYIRYLSESGSWDSARETFKSLISRHGHSYEFWLMYYNWELICWAKFTGSDGSASASRGTPSPSLATAVLKKALHREDLDWPEKIMDTYVTHCEHYEDAEELQIAVVDIRKSMRVVAKRREREAAEAAAAQQQAASLTAAASEQAAQSSEVDGDAHIGKRKRGAEPDVNGSASKRPRADVMETTETPEPEQAPKRDREHASIMVENLPADMTTLKVRQFFRDCGTINLLKVLPANGAASALIEFESKDDAQGALTKDQKILDENTISVQPATQTTLFVTNFPPTADEAYVRDLFSPYGEILEVRFPSLKFNTHRRFCYVQFAASASAYAATEENNKDVGEKLRLVAKISDPSNRQDRSGPAEEGREIHISNLDWKATEADLVELFTAYGTVETARIPTKANGGSKGFGFVVFSTKDAANTSLAMDNQSFRNRTLHVHLSSRTGPKRQATTVVSRVSRSHSPATFEADANGVRGSPGSSNANAEQDSHPAGDRQQRTLGLMNIPDTVNDARVRSLVEPFGSLVKIVLRPDHQGAIVEFRDVNDAGKAAMGLEGKEIVSGRNIRVGRVDEMMKWGAEKKVDKIQVGKQKDNTNKKAGSSTLSQPSLPVRRPPQPGSSARGHGGRRGGLGVKKGNDRAAEMKVDDKGKDADGAAATAQGQKSNNDFRAMLDRSKPKAESTSTPPPSAPADGEKETGSAVDGEMQS